MFKFEEYLEQFNTTISAFDFVVGLILTAILAMVIRMYYIRFGDAVSNRRRFANIFLPLALSTMLIITIVKSSIALSLGLVGALSIVRFRAAIKDPEELTYLFLVIGLGLAMGANQFIVGLIAIPAILFLLWLHKYLGAKNVLKSDGRMFVNIDTDSTDFNLITEKLTAILPFVELKRMDQSKKGLSLSYIIKADDIQAIDQIRKEISGITDNTKISFIEQPDLIL
jgi:uncharacterized membrane protein YhiD involved in acid resistance